MDNLNQQSSQMIIDKLAKLSRIAVDRQYALQAAIWKPYQEAGYTKSIRDAGYLFTYLAESLAVNAPALFLV